MPVQALVHCTLCCHCHPGTLTLESSLTHGNSSCAGAHVLRPCPPVSALAQLGVPTPTCMCSVAHTWHRPVHHLLSCYAAQGAPCVLPSSSFLREQLPPQQSSSAHSDPAPGSIHWALSCPGAGIGPSHRQAQPLPRLHLSPLQEPPVLRWCPWLRQCPLLRWLLRRRCVLCGSPEGPSAHTCPAPCGAQYCRPCWRDVGQACLACAPDPGPSSGDSSSEDQMTYAD